MSKVALCAIGRLENLYAREFVEHYKNLGIDHIFIYDNNHFNEEFFQDVLQDYIDEGFVEIIDFRGIVQAQNKAYNDCYLKHGSEYDAIMMADIDEYLVLEHDKTIQSYIRRFPSDWQAILINWDCRNANGKVEYENKPLFERFTESIPTNKCVQYPNIPEDMHIKTIVRGGLPNVKWYGQPHVPITVSTCYNASGVRCSNSPWQPVDFRMARIVHFVTKSLQEWVENKCVRGTADRDMNCFKATYKNRFWGYNEKTEEMIEWLNKNGYSGYFHM